MKVSSLSGNSVYLEDDEAITVNLNVHKETPNELTMYILYEVFFFAKSLCTSKNFLNKKYFFM